jgi:hypothetical protein
MIKRKQINDKVHSRLLKVCFSKLKLPNNVYFAIHDRLTEKLYEISWGQIRSKVYDEIHMISKVN